MFCLPKTAWPPTYFQGGINMEMNDILNGLNSCDDDCSESTSSSCGCGSNFGGSGGCFPGGFGQGGFGQGGVTGCGFGSWIWILLILFYCGCGRKNTNNCCRERRDECCDRGRSGGGILGNCGSYLFLLVILFLCNNGNQNSCLGGGCGSQNNFGCGTSC